MGLNHIYKVIWSKTKNAWVVVSEIAKRDGKSSVKSVVTSLAGKSVAAVMVAMVMCGGVASANTQYGVGADGGFDGTAIGENAKANSPRSTVIGKNAVASGSGDGSIVIGTNAFGMGYNTSPNSVIAIGNGARANTGSGGPTMAIGESAQAEATAGDAMAIGYNSKALGYSGGIAIGSNNSVYGNNLVLGKNSHINQYNGNDPFDSISIGNMNTLDGNEDSFVAGAQNHLIDNSGTNRNFSNILIGSKTTVNGTTNTVIGARYTTITGDYITAIGDVKRDATNWSDNQVVIGHHSAPEAVATVSNSIGVGTTGKTITLGTFAGDSSSLSVVSFGDSSSAGGAYTRQLKNVSAGVISPTSTDAINGSQLYRTIEALYSLGSPDVYMHVNDGTSTQGAGNASINLGKANEKGGATGQYSITIGLSSTAKSKNSIVIGKNGRDMDADSDNSVVMGTEAQVGLAQNGIAIGKRAMLFDDGPTNPRNDNSIAIGNNAVIRQANNSIVLGKDSNITGGDNSVAIGSNAVVTRGQLNVGGGYSSSSNSQYGNQRGGNQGIAVGSNSAISGSIGSTSIGRYSSIIGADDSVVIGSYSGIKFTDDGSTITIPKDIHVLGNRSFVKGASNITVLGNDINVEYVPNNPATDFSGSVIMGDKSTANSYVKPTDSTINGDTFTSADYAGQGTTINPLKNGNIVSVGSVGNERQIKNVAAGEVTATSTDAINGSQLYSVADQLAKGGFG